MRHGYGARYQNVKIRPLEREDIERLRVWRNDVSKTQYLRRIKNITPEMQEKWYDAYLDDSDMLTFAIEETEDLKRLVGSLELYDFNGDSAEFGKIQIGDSEAHGRGIGRKSTVMILLIGFRKLGLKKIVASVHQENTAARSIYLRIGFQVVGNHPASMGGLEDELEIDEKRLKEINTYVDRIELD